MVLLSFVPATLQGCVEKIGGWLRKNVLVVAAAALGIAFVEVRDNPERGLGLNPGCLEDRGRGEKGAEQEVLTWECVFGVSCMGLG